MATTDEQPKRRGGRRPRVGISHEQELDIIDAYAHTDRSMHEVARALGINETYPYRVLEKHHIKWRRGVSPESFDDYVAEHPEVQDAMAGHRLRATERNVPSTPVLDALVDQVQLIEIEDTETWLVEVTEKFLVSASNIDGALQAGKGLRPGGRITSIRIKS